MVHGGSGWWRLAGFIFVTNCLMDEWRLVADVVATGLFEIIF